MGTMNVWHHKLKFFKNLFFFLFQILWAQPWLVRLTITTIQFLFSSLSQVKPVKSWDNLTTKSFGGYGFGYGFAGYLKNHMGAHYKQTHCTHAHNAKSSECLLLCPDQGQSSLSYECLDKASQTDKHAQYQHRQRSIVNVQQNPQITRLWMSQRSAPRRVALWKYLCCKASKAAIKERYEQLIVCWMYYNKVTLT